jgi:hypothetical protein
MVVRLRPLLLLALLSGCPDSLAKKLHPSADSPVATPTNLVAKADDVNLVLSWDDNAVGESGYRLERSNGAFETSPVADFQILSPDATSAVIPAPDAVSYFRVFAVTDTLESDPSNVVRVAPAPRGVSVTCESPTQAVVRWQVVVGELGYQVQVSTDGGLTWKHGADASAGSTNAMITGLVPDMEYLVRVVANFSEGGPGDPSTPVEFITLTTSVTWTVITTSGDMGRNVSFVRLPSGAEHLSHYDAINTNVLYTTRPPGGAYSTTTIDSGPTGTEDVGADGTSIALDGAGKVHILATDATGKTLRYTTNASGAWAEQTLDSHGGVRARIVWDPTTGALHVAEHLSGDSLAHLVKAPGDVWTIKGHIVPTRDGSRVYELAMGPGGLLHAATIETASSSRVVTYGVDPVTLVDWPREVVPLSSSLLRTSAVSPDAISLAVDSAGAAHLAVHDALSRSLWYATNASGSWVAEFIDQSPGADVGWACSLALQPSTGRIHVAYYDATRKDLRYARKDPGGPWVRRLLDAVGDVGSFTSITVDAAGGVAVAYRDETNRRLKIARGAP